MIIMSGYDEHKLDLNFMRDKYDVLGWDHTADPFRLVNPKTGEYCKVYVADDEDFDVNGLPVFKYYCNDDWKEDAYVKEGLEKIPYHLVLNKSLNKIAQINPTKAKYWPWVRCFILPAAVLGHPVEE